MKLLKLLGGFVIVAIVIGAIASSGGGDTASTDSQGKAESAKTESKSFDLEDIFNTDLSGNDGAVSRAKSYLKTMPFSLEGLSKQLEFEGFSEEEAKYGAENCGANWKEQAVKKAKNYLDTMAFSADGLEKQLKFEGFTKDEAKHGVENCGANWNEQAVKKAESYLDIYPNWSKKQLVDQLEFEGFTEDEAEYGANNCN